MDLVPADLWNAIGWLPGATDELLLAGAHHDAWDFGAVDSGSGVVATIEAARVLGAAARRGWRPRRTLLFTAWDGEELSLIGSSEFSERFAADLQRRVVAVVNLDGAVGGAGGVISASGAAQWAAWIELAAAHVPDPLEPGSLLAAWLRQEDPPPVGGRPKVSFLGASSDHAAFAVALGLPAAGIGIGEDFGPYHSTLDDFRWVARLGDPSFLWHRTLTQWLVAALEIAADVPRLPVVVADYGAQLERDLADYTATIAQTGDAQLASALAAARQAAREWREAGARFDARGRQALAAGDAVALARWNELARTVDRRFLVADGLQGQLGPRHLLVAPGERTGAGRALMPTLAEDLRFGALANARGKLVLLGEMLRGQSAALAAP
jgi:N-acetylated-alpha-linked acidic dipeptidase